MSCICSLTNGIVICRLLCNYICMCVFLLYVAKIQMIRPFIKCFEKGTPNFLSVPPCEFVLCMHKTLYMLQLFCR